MVTPRSTDTHGLRSVSPSRLSPSSLAILYKEGAHLIPLGKPGTKGFKRPSGGPWKTRAGLDTVQNAARDGRAIGLVPGSLNLTVVDIDCPDVHAAGDYLTQQLGDPLLISFTLNHGAHLYYVSPNPQPRNSKWYLPDGTEGGDIRSDGGYVVVYDLDGIVGVLGKRAESAPVALAPILRGQTAPKPPRGAGTADSESLTRILDALRGAGIKMRRVGNRYRGAPCPVCRGGEDDRLWVEDGATAVIVGCNNCGTGQDYRDALRDALRLKPIVVPGTRTREHLRAALDALDISLRYNVRACWIEVRHKRGGWAHITTRGRAAILDRIERNCVVEKEDGETRPAHWGRDNFTLRVDALVSSAEVDPFLIWLESLPEWDGTPRLDSWLASIFTVEDCPDTLFQWACKSTLLCAVQRAYRPGTKHDTAVVLVGRQGIAKSTVWRALLPDSRDEWFSDTFQLHASTQQMAEATQGRVLVEMSELVGGSRADIEALKAFMTRTNDNAVRLAYRHDPEESPRRFVLVGTTNAIESLPNDPTGNRRWMPVLCEQGSSEHIRHWLGEHRTQLWAEALKRKDEPAYLSTEGETLQAQHNERYRRNDATVEDALADFLASQITADGFTFTQAFQAVSSNGEHVNQRRLRDALLQAGCTVHREGASGRRTWRVRT